jgi:23S rRNA pseudouridine2605 synthase
LLSGVQLEDGPARALRAQVLGSSAGETTLQVTLAEGRKREVRRLFAAVGHPVQRLKRVSFGPIELGDLRSARWRRLDDREIAALNS